jgi:hypothetical protein
MMRRGVSLPLPSEMQRQVGGDDSYQRARSDGADKKTRSEARQRLRQALQNSKKHYYDDSDTGIYRDYDIAELFASLKGDESSGGTVEILRPEGQEPFAEGKEIYLKLQEDPNSAICKLLTDKSIDFTERLNSYPLLERSESRSIIADNVVSRSDSSRSCGERDRLNLVSRLSVPLQGPAPPGFLDLKVPETQAAIQSTFGEESVSVSMYLSRDGSQVEAEVRSRDVSTLSAAEGIVVRRISEEHPLCWGYQGDLTSHAASSVSFIDSMIDRFNAW